MRCPIKTCPRVVGAGMLLCAVHWTKVPTPLQREVNRTWRARLANPHDGPTVRAHEEAKAAAIAAVEQLENGARPRRPGEGGVA